LPLPRKNLDMIIANDVSQENIGFNSDNNAVVIVTTDAETVLPETSKKQLAYDIITAIASQYTPQKP